jgi:uracil-DNA glycosylase
MAQLDCGPSDKDVLEALVARLRACRVCASELPFEPRPVFQISRTARILIASQAPGTRVHASGKPFSDPSGDRLRDWMGMSPAQFYDDRLVAIIPMGLCYPGRANGGDAPPRPECAPLWRQQLLAQMPDLRLTLLVGTYAQRAALGAGRMVDRVRGFADYLPRYFPLPHPSWRSQIWMKNNPWFESDVLPSLRARVHDVIADRVARRSGAPIGKFG